MNVKQAGFTLIELIVVIIILGILAAIAAPKFFNFKSDAAEAAVKGAAAAMSSAFVMNYAKFQLNSTATDVVRFSAANACAAASNSIMQPELDSNKFSVSSDASCAGSSAGTTTTCTLQSQDDTSKTATVTVICTG